MRRVYRVSPPVMRSDDTFNRGLRDPMGSVDAPSNGMRAAERAAGDPARTEVTDDQAAESPHTGKAEGQPLPDRIGPYRVEALIGRGGMGEVYRAWDPRLERKVAVKRILSEAANPKARARFWREARVLAALRHDNLVALHDIGEDAAGLYLAMELISGRSLSEAQAARWPMDGAVALVRELAAAVGTAHAGGIIHRDIKPSNILIEPDGTPRLIDFGLARRGDEDEVTSSGSLVGTWSWMAPEQISGEPLGPAADVHALGALLFTLLAGEAPYQRESREATAAAILSGARANLATLRPDLPSSLVQLISTALSRDPTRRHRDGRTLSLALEDLLKNLDLAPDHEVIRSAFENARAAIQNPGFSTGLASRIRHTRPVRTRRPLLVGAGVVAGLAAITFVAMGPPTVESPATDTASSPQASLPSVVERSNDEASRLVLDALTQKPRRVVAVLPLRDAGAADSANGRSSLGAVVAELLRDDLGAASPGVSMLTWRELLARSTKRPEDLVPADLDAAVGSSRRVDAVIDGNVERSDGLVHISLALRTTDAASVRGNGAPLATFSISAPETALSGAVRALVQPIAKELGLVVDPANLPRGGLSPRGSAQATGILIEAERALHSEHWRAFRKLVGAALAEDPELPRALLHRVQLDVALERTDEAKQTLEQLIARDDLSPRDQSLAAIYHARYVMAASHLSEQIQAHLARFPHDIEARLELLRERFRAQGSAKLLAAVDFADELLETAPNATQAASKLVRALTWMGRPEEARSRLRAHGIEPGSPDAPRVTDFVFAELDLYTGRYDDARRAFESIREPDGDLTYYAANMRLAALMLDDRCDDAVESGAFLLRNAASPTGELGVDWTYLLSVHALMCAGRPTAAYYAILEWPQRTNGTSGSRNYRSLSQVARVLTDPDPAGVAQEMLDSNRDGGAIYSLDFLVATFARDAAMLNDHIQAMRNSQLGGGGTYGVQIRARMLRALEARVRFLQGDVETALDAFARLAFFSDSEMVSEGDVYERTRWMGVYASHLEEAGHVELAREVWHALRASGFGRVLAMDMSYLADVRLARLK